MVQIVNKDLSVRWEDSHPGLKKFLSIFNSIISIYSSKASIKEAPQKSKFTCPLIFNNREPTRMIWCFKYFTAWYNNLEYSWDRILVIKPKPTVLDYSG